MAPGANAKISKQYLIWKKYLTLQAFFAQLFSHVGLWALVIGYSVMGAFVFSYLEKPYEKLTRLEVGNNRGKTLDELYGITGQTTPPSNYLHFMLSYSLAKRRCIGCKICYKQTRLKGFSRCVHSCTPYKNFSYLF